ncbi:hypothetical protein FVW20_02805 [Desulfovibrio oxamicus]|uniref:Uncharacterized protein n=1 Tax=Nitratidesulfovibrio oxamicus TaxID=32016 RepID=A0ABS0J0N1_9BACT|nr:hypothetical protein [Nitratidesulfovibrio oxamicus]MBG3875981.1 hypothetical protein [Nitratidesulfovibrio oxamicus]
MRRSPAVFALLAATLLLSGCVRQYEGAGDQPEYYRNDEQLEYMLRANEPISNLRDEGFEPLPGQRNVYFMPGTDLMVRCSDKFDLNASMKRTFHCHYVDRRLRKIPNSDFVVQINPWRGDEGFSPYR